MFPTVDVTSELELRVYRLKVENEFLIQAVEELHAANKALTQRLTRLETVLKGERLITPQPS